MKIPRWVKLHPVASMVAWFYALVIVAVVVYYSWCLSRAPRPPTWPDVPDPWDYGY